MKISIITINYNNLSGLKKTRESIVSQTCKDYEWIVVDGGSTDGAKEFLQEHADEMAYWCSEKDKGVYNAQNKGIAIAKGDYIICMNSGDVFHDENVLKNVCSQDLTADVIYGDWMRVYPDGREEKKDAPKEISPYFFYYDNICHQAMFVKTSVMQKYPFDETYKVYADWLKWRELYQRGCSFCYVPVMVCDYDADTGISEKNKNVCEQELVRMSEDLPIYALKAELYYTKLLHEHLNGISISQKKHIENLEKIRTNQMSCIENQQHQIEAQQRQMEVLQHQIEIQIADIEEKNRNIKKISKEKCRYIIGMCICLAIIIVVVLESILNI